MDALATMLRAQQPDVLPGRKILLEVSARHGIPVDRLRAGIREVPIVRARHEACFRIRYELKYTLKQIANVVGMKEHTAALHAIRRHQERLEA